MPIQIALMRFHMRTPFPGLQAWGNDLSRDPIRRLASLPSEFDGVSFRVVDSGKKPLSGQVVGCQKRPMRNLAKSERKMLLFVKKKRNSRIRPAQCLSGKRCPAIRHGPHIAECRMNDPAPHGPTMRKIQVRLLLETNVGVRLNWGLVMCYSLQCPSAG